MALRTHDNYGAPSYGAIGRPVAGMIFHTPENVDATLAQAIAVTTWQKGSGNTSGGSYHGVLGHDSARYSTCNPYRCPTEDHWVMVRSVPWNMACGGVTTSRDPAVWGPERYPWIKQLVHPAAYADPNRYFHQIALGGKAAQWASNGLPVGPAKCLARWVLTLEQAYGYSSVLTLHRFWQLNRSDPGAVDFADKVLAQYEAIVKPPAPAPAPTPTPTPAPAPKTYTQAEVDALLAAERAKVPAQIEAAVAPYRRRIDEFKQLAGRALS